MSVNKRIGRLLKALAGDAAENIEHFWHKKSLLSGEKIPKWRQKANPKYSGSQHTGTKDQNNDKQKTDQTEGEAEKKTENKQQKSSTDFQPNSPYPQNLIEDLKLFKLSPPASLAEVKKARNAEIKKYHPDHFATDPQKAETAKRILQIYNSAFERLKKYYTNKK